MTLEMIVRNKELINKETCGYVNDPIHQAVILTGAQIIDFLQSEREYEYLEGYGDDYIDEEGEIKEEEYEKDFDKIWDERNLGVMQEDIENFTGLCTFSMYIDNELYFVGTNEEIFDDTILDYAEWCPEEEN